MLTIEQIQSFQRNALESHNDVGIPTAPDNARVIEIVILLMAVKASLAQYQAESRRS